MRLVRGFLICLCILAATAGCGKKVVRQSMVFDLDKVFSGIFASTAKESEEQFKEKGIRLAREGDFKSAIDAFMRHVEEYPEDYFGFNAIAVCYKNLGDDTNAMRNFERALEFADNPEDHAKVLANIGNLYHARNKFQTALVYYKEAASVFEKNPLYHILIARTFINLGEDERARKVLTQAEQNARAIDTYERSDERGLGYYHLAHCFASLGEEDKVYKYLELAIKTNPDVYVRRTEKDINDQKNLLFSLKEDPRIKTLLDRYSAKTSTGRWLVRE
ncbi:MAG: tetratricopeptide repeat protein [Desulfomonile sp.]|nr:tetratricopeptide repeat protein [Desulfomonile sp.]